MGGVAAGGARPGRYQHVVAFFHHPAYSSGPHGGAIIERPTAAVRAPGVEPGDNPYHFVLVHVNGDDTWLEVIGVDWGRGFQPYRSARSGIGGSVPPR